MKPVTQLNSGVQYHVVNSLLNPSQEVHPHLLRSLVMKKLPRKKNKRLSSCNCLKLPEGDLGNITAGGCVTIVFQYAIGTGSSVRLKQN